MSSAEYGGFEFVRSLGFQFSCSSSWRISKTRPTQHYRLEPPATDFPTSEQPLKQAPTIAGGRTEDPQDRLALFRLSRDPAPRAFRVDDAD